jgi:hypothetical protein
MGKKQQTSTAGDLSSMPFIVGRLQACIAAAQDKMKVDPDIKKEQMTTALKALVKGLYQNPMFQKQKLLTVEQLLLKDGAVKIEDISEIEALKPYSRLAEMAYEEDTEELRRQLKEEGFELHTHGIENNVADVGYYTALDHENKILMIGVKGTSSFADAITDCVAVSMPHVCAPNCPFTGHDNDREIKCHEGILTGALKLHENVYDIVKNVGLRANYKIHIVGHSLGAGTAALLGILLRSRANEKLQNPEYLKVWAFAAPPVVDKQASLESKSFITTIVNNNDVVPRLSLSNLEIFSKQLNDLAKMMQEDNNGKAVSGYSGSRLINAKLKEFEGDASPAQYLGEFLVESFKMHNDDDPSNLFVPGKVILLYETMDSPAEDVEEEDKVQTRACVVEGTIKVRYRDNNRIGCECR